MKKVLLLIILLFLIYAPFLTIKPIQNYYEYFDYIAQKYECYPIETCQADFNNDGKPDIFTIVDEPNEVWQHYYRLKIYVEENNQTKEILNIRYDYNAPTQIALYEQFGRKELVIYDNINKEQFFFWDGIKLSPIWNGKSVSPGDELAVGEHQIQKAMSLNDKSTFTEKSLINLTLYYMFALYYFVLFSTVGMYFYFQRKLKQRLY